MPARLLTPIEIIKKKAVFLSEYEVVNIFINIDGSPYIRVEYVSKDDNGESIGREEVILKGQELVTFLATYSNVFTQIKTFSYNVGKAGGLIPQDAGVS